MKKSTAGESNISPRDLFYHFRETPRLHDDSYDWSRVEESNLEARAGGKPDRGRHKTLKDIWLEANPHSHWALNMARGRAAHSPIEQVFEAPPSQVMDDQDAVLYQVSLASVHLLPMVRHCLTLIASFPESILSREVPTMAEQKPTSFLEDNNGNKSSMRLMSFIALVASIGFGLIALLHKGAGINGVYITSAFLLAAFAPKALQKFIETQG